jgi:hypothetical protein
MKAIYLNIDPYLQAVADWLNAGKPGTAPCFDPLPVAVTIPAGQTACIYCPSSGEAETDPADSGNSVTINGQTFYFWADEEYIPADAIAFKVVTGLSALAPSAKYYVVAVTGDTTAKFKIGGGEIEDAITVTIPVLVRRETASGPVDLVDFTPPAAGAPSAADIKAALVEAGAGALEGVFLNGTKWLKEGETDASSVYITTPNPSSVTGDSDILVVTSPGS